jgi:hypothetical protein
MEREEKEGRHEYARSCEKEKEKLNVLSHRLPS